jgi:Zn-dependent protease with chaperone function
LILKGKDMMNRFSLRTHLNAAVPALIFLTLIIASCAISNGGGGAPSKESKPSTKPLDPAQAQRLQQVMTPLIQAMNKPLPLNQVKITLLDDKQINAGNAGGGKFIITTGLLQKANDDELRGVLAHEIAHADLGHVAKAQALGTGLNIGTIVLNQIIPGSGLITPIIADLGIMKPYSRTEEYQADAHGVEILNKAGFNGKQIMAGTLTWLLQTEGPSGGFFATHPGTQDRIQRIESMP